MDKPSPQVEFDTETGRAGELHQLAGGGDVLTTNQGVPVADDQNSLRAGPAARRCKGVVALDGGSAGQFIEAAKQGRVWDREKMARMVP